MSTLVIFLDIYIYIFFGVMTPQIDYVTRILLRIVANFLHTCIRDCRFFWVLVPPARLFAAFRANAGVVEILSFLL